MVSCRKKLLAGTIDTLTIVEATAEEHLRAGFA
jgi:hypothetical protein